MPVSTLFRRAAAVYISDGAAAEVQFGVDVLIKDNRVASVGSSIDAPPDARVIDASTWLLLPGLVNGHHHLSQQLTRTRGCSATLVEWLIELYPAWARLDDELAYHAARVGIAELLLTGTTTVSDFTYFYPRGHERIFDAQVTAARELGCRFAPVRGGIAELEAGVRAVVGNALDSAFEKRDVFLAEVDRAVNDFHDPEPDSLCRVSTGLTEKAYGDPSLMVELAELAERHDLRLHTHLHPRPDERAFVHERLGVDPVTFLEKTGWWGERLWVAHGTSLEPDEIRRMADDSVGLCTCPSSNARFGTPIAPALDLARAGGAVAIGVDGAASNDSGDMIGECELALQVQRIRAGANGVALEAVTPSTVVGWATTGGARVLGWPELGRLEEGSLADIACFDFARLDYVGADDPLAALLLCGVSHVATLVMVNGRIVVEGGRLTLVDEDELARDGRSAEARLWERIDEPGVGTLRPLAGRVN